MANKQYETIEEQKLESDYLEAHDKKALILSQYCNSHTGMGTVDWLSYYNDIYDRGINLQGEYDTNDGKANIILLTKVHKGMQTKVLHTIDDIGKYLENEFTILGPVTYFGNSPSYKNAVDCYALVIDVDDVSVTNLKNILLYIDNESIPRPTYIINSGKGIHLVYKLAVRCCMRPALRTYLNDIKKGLSECIWNADTSSRNSREWQHCCQNYRAVGSKTRGLLDTDGKLIERRTVAYRIGDHVTLTSLVNDLKRSVEDLEFKDLEYSSDNNRIEKIEYGDEESERMKFVRKEYPEWYEKVVVNGEKAKSIPFSRAIYDKFLERSKTETKLHHRYWTIYTLTSFAIKCGVYDANRNPNPVTKDELIRDVNELVPILNQLKPDDPLTEFDINAALKLYNDPILARKLTRRYLSFRSQIEMKPQKRNNRNQSEHGAFRREVGDEQYRRAVDDGRVGRPSSEKRVLDYFLENPQASSQDASETLGLSLATVRKHRKRDIEALVRAHLENNPECSISELAEAVGITRKTAAKYKNKINDLII